MKHNKSSKKPSPKQLKALQKGRNSLKQKIINDKIAQAQSIGFNSANISVRQIIRNKTSHAKRGKTKSVNHLTNQINELKKTITNLEKQIIRLESEVLLLDVPHVIINKTAKILENDLNDLQFRKQQQFSQYI